MKYTVVIRQPVPEAIQAGLIQELSLNFELSADQASKLASRRSGRLMKPTSRKRAERLMQVFQEAGAQVALEEVREDTTQLRDPFASERPGLVGAATLPLSGSGFPDSGPLSDSNFGTPAAGYAAPSADWGAGAVATLPAPAWTGQGVAQTGYSDALLPLDPLEPVPAFVQHDAELVTPGQVQSGVPEMNLGLAGAPAAAVSSPAATDPISDDAWADFTGSLSSAPAAKTSSESANPTSVVTVDTSLDPVRSARRSSLSRRVLLSTLLPLGLFTVVTLGFLVYELPRAQNNLITQNAQAVAVAVGSNLDVTDQNTVYAQLDALIKRSSVGFVQVNLPDGTTFFRSKNAYTDGPLSEKIAAWVQGHPNNSTFVQSGSAADSYRYQLSLLEQVGAGDSDQAKALRTSVADPANQQSSTTTYLLSSINVTQNRKSERVVAQGISSSTGTPLYSIVVGVPGDEAFAELRKTLLLVLGVALLAFVIATLLAARTARVVVQPIERLVRAADAISMGDLDRPVTIERNDEIGDLAQALERMRLSLEAAMERLRRRRKGA